MRKATITIYRVKVSVEVDQVLEVEASGGTAVGEIANESMPLPRWRPAMGVPPVGVQEWSDYSVRWAPMEPIA